MGYSPQGRKESDTTERLDFTYFLIIEGQGSSLIYFVPKA